MASQSGRYGALVRSGEDEHGEFDGQVAAATRGDRVAVARVLAIVRPLVLRYCRARLGRTEGGFAAADEVAHEVCMAVLTGLSRNQAQGRPLWEFVYGVAVHQVADARRVGGHRRRAPAGELSEVPPVVPRPERGLSWWEAGAAPGGLLEVLPAYQREIVVLRVVVGLSVRQTAQALGCDAGTVRVAQHRAMARLRAAIAETLESSQPPHWSEAGPT